MNLSAASHSHAWPQVLITELAEQGRGTFSNGPFGSNLLTSELTQTGVPVIYIRDIRNGKYDRVSDVCVTNEKAKQLDTCQVVAGDILISKVGDPPGVAATYPLNEPPGIITQDVIRLRPDLGKAYPGYLVHYLNSTFGRRKIREITVQATRARFGLRDFKTQEIPLPPLEEQKRIAAILDAADELRTKRRESLAQLDALLQSTFLDLFGDPVTNPKGWNIVKLSELGTLDRGHSKHRPRNEPALLGGDHPLIQTGDVANSDGYIRDYKSTYSDLGLKQSKMWPKGTLCITIAANIANTGILTFDSCFPDSVVGFLSDEPSRAEYVQGLFWFFREILDRQASQVAQKNINLGVLRNFPVPNPPLDLQRRFAAIVTSVEQQKTQVRAQVAELDALFASLQSRAFRGEL